MLCRSLLLPGMSCGLKGEAIHLFLPYVSRRKAARFTDDTRITFAERVYQQTNWHAEHLDSAGEDVRHSVNSVPRGVSGGNRWSAYELHPPRALQGNLSICVPGARVSRERSHAPLTGENCSAVGVDYANLANVAWTLVECLTDFFARLVVG